MAMNRRLKKKITAVCVAVCFFFLQIAPTGLADNAPRDEPQTQSTLAPVVSLSPTVSTRPTTTGQPPAPSTTTNFLAGGNALSPATASNIVTASPVSINISTSNVANTNDSSGETTPTAQQPLPVVTDAETESVIPTAQNETTPEPEETVNNMSADTATQRATQELATFYNHTNPVTLTHVTETAFDPPITGTRGYYTANIEGTDWVAWGVVDSSGRILFSGIAKKGEAAVILNFSVELAKFAAKEGSFQRISNYINNYPADSLSQEISFSLLKNFLDLYAEDNSRLTPSFDRIGDPFSRLIGPNILSGEKVDYLISRIVSEWDLSKQVNQSALANAYGSLYSVLYGRAVRNWQATKTTDAVLVAMKRLVDAAVSNLRFANESAFNNLFKMISDYHLKLPVGVYYEPALPNRDPKVVLEGLEGWMNAHDIQNTNANWVYNALLVAETARDLPYYFSDPENVARSKQLFEQSINYLVRRMNIDLRSTSLYEILEILSPNFADATLEAFHSIAPEVRDSLVSLVPTAFATVPAAYQNNMLRFLAFVLNQRDISEGKRGEILLFLQPIYNQCVSNLKNTQPPSNESQVQFDYQEKLSIAIELAKALDSKEAMEPILDLFIVRFEGSGTMPAESVADYEKRKELIYDLWRNSGIFVADQLGLYGRNKAQRDIALNILRSMGPGSGKHINYVYISLDRMGQAEAYETTGGIYLGFTRNVANDPALLSRLLLGSTLAHEAGHLMHLRNGPGFYFGLAHLYAQSQKNPATNTVNADHFAFVNGSGWPNYREEAAETFRKWFLDSKNFFERAKNIAMTKKDFILMEKYLLMTDFFAQAQGKDGGIPLYGIPGSDASNLGNNQIPIGQLDILSRDSQNRITRIRYEQKVYSFTYTGPDLTGVEEIQEAVPEVVPQETVTGAETQETVTGVETLENNEQNNNMGVAAVTQRAAQELAAFYNYTNPVTLTQVTETAFDPAVTGIRGYYTANIEGTDWVAWGVVDENGNIIQSGLAKNSDPPETLQKMARELAIFSTGQPERRGSIFQGITDYISAMPNLSREIQFSFLKSILDIYHENGPAHFQTTMGMAQPFNIIFTTNSRIPDSAVAYLTRRIFEEWDPADLSHNGGIAFNYQSIYYGLVLRAGNDIDNPDPTSAVQLLKNLVDLIASADRTQHPGFLYYLQMLSDYHLTIIENATKEFPGKDPSIVLHFIQNADPAFQNVTSAAYQLMEMLKDPSQVEAARVIAETGIRKYIDMNAAGNFAGEAYILSTLNLKTFNPNINRFNMLDETTRQAIVEIMLAHIDRDDDQMPRCRALAYIYQKGLIPSAQKEAIREVLRTRLEVKTQELMATPFPDPGVFPINYTMKVDVVAFIAKAIDRRDLLDSLVERFLVRFEGADGFAPESEASFQERRQALLEIWHNKGIIFLDRINLLGKDADTWRLMRQYMDATGFAIGQRVNIIQFAFHPFSNATILGEGGPPTEVTFNRDFYNDPQRFKAAAPWIYVYVFHEFGHAIFNASPLALGLESKRLLVKQISEVGLRNPYWNRANNYREDEADAVLYWFRDNPGILQKGLAWAVAGKTAFLQKYLLLAKEFFIQDNHFAMYQVKEIQPREQGRSTFVDFVQTGVMTILAWDTEGRIASMSDGQKTYSFTYAGPDLTRVETQETVTEAEPQETVTGVGTQETVPEAETQETVPVVGTQETVPEVETQETVPEVETQETVLEAETQETVTGAETQEPVTGTETQEPVTGVDTQENVAEVVMTSNQPEVIETLQNQRLMRPSIYRRQGRYRKPSSRTNHFYPYYDYGIQSPSGYTPGDALEQLTSGYLQDDWSDRKLKNWGHYYPSENDTYQSRYQKYKRPRQKIFSEKTKRRTKTSQKTNPRNPMLELAAPATAPLAQVQASLYSQQKPPISTISPAKKSPD